MSSNRSRRSAAPMPSNNNNNNNDNDVVDQGNRWKCVNNDCLASEYDNIFYKGSKIHLIKSGVVHFYKEFSILKEARKISDHLPVYLEFSIN